MDSGHDVLVGAFTEAVGTTLREMAGLEVVPRGVTTGRVTEPLSFCANLRLSSPGDGDLTLDFPREVVKELARRVFAQAGFEADDPLLADCVGEVANVVAGQAKTLLFGTPQHFVFSLPSVMPEALPNPEAERLILTFTSEIGEFVLYLRPPF
jgi:CheY-specific phosphatase CheX